LTRQTSPALGAFQRALLLVSIAGLAYATYLNAGSERPPSERAVPLLLWSGLVLGAVGPVLGDRHPRVRWALAIASGGLVIVVFVLLRRIMTT